MSQKQSIAFGANTIQLSEYTVFSGMFGTRREIRWSLPDKLACTYVMFKPRLTRAQITMAIEMNYIICTALIKVSILFFYRRITASLTITFVYWVWASIILCVLYAVTFILLIAFTCSPANGFFHVFDIAWRLQNELHCRDEGAIIVAVAAISTVQDFIICLLPVFLIWNLQIPKTQKFALCGIFGLGLV